MFLIDTIKKDPSALSSKTIEQIVVMCGDGKLKDNSVCSNELREFLTLQTSEKLADYAVYCLENAFLKSGVVLQDCINEIGRRLSYDVKNGRYAGVQNDIGFDGFWFDGTNRIVVEVKTTDAYRINLDTITNYANKIALGATSSTNDICTLIVVGRQDTGDMEAQVRGSKHAWNVRLISVDALIKLMFVKEDLDNPLMLEKIRKILLPFEYTRVDNIVELVFETQQETEGKVAAEAEIEVVDNSEETASEEHEERKIEMTPRGELQAKRQLIASAFFGSHGLNFEKRTTTNFSDISGATQIICAVSKRYRRDYQPYWYALHPQWVELLQNAKNGFFILGCMDTDIAYALPIKFVVSLLDELNKTTVKGKSYWHIALNSDDGVIKLNLSKVGKKIDLTPYQFKIRDY